MNTLKKVIFTSIAFFCFFILIELLAGSYFYVHEDGGTFFSHKNAAKQIMKDIQEIYSKMFPKVEVNKIGNNPFIKFFPQEYYKYHPVIDYTSAGTHDTHIVPLDYFGFRNETDLYFVKYRTYKLVVITGGSEVAGYTHLTTIAQNLEEYLNSASKIKYKVINLGSNSYTLINEIKVYVHLVYHLKPEIVISHTGWNDLYLGSFIPYKFTNLGLNFVPESRIWANKFSKTNFPISYGFNYIGLSEIVPAFIQNIIKYKKIVESNNGRFIIGIQPFDKISVKAKGDYDREEVTNNNAMDADYVMRGFAYKRIINNFKKLHFDLKKTINFVDFNDITNATNPFYSRPVPFSPFFDHIHTTDKTAKIIAKRYAKIILDHKKTIKTSFSP